MTTQISEQSAEHLRQKFAIVLLWFIPFVWSSNYIIARLAGGMIPPNSLAFGRWLVAVLLMLPLVWRSKNEMLQHAKAEWKQCLLLGALGMWICGAFVYIAAATTTAANIALIYAAAPVGIAVASSLVLKETLSLSRKLGLVCALFGVLFIIFRGEWGTLFQVRFVPGDMWMLASTSAWVAYSVLYQRWRSKLPPIQRLFCISTGGLFILLPFTLYETLTQSLHWLSLYTLTIVVAVGVFPGFLSYLSYAFMLRQLGASRAGLVLYLGPLYSTFFAWWVLDEMPQWFHMVGAMLVLPSIYLATIRQRAK